MPETTSKKPHFMLSLVGKYKTRTKTNDPHVTVNVLTGSDSHMVYSGTLTMTEREWEDFSGALGRSLKGRVEITEGLREPWTPISDGNRPARKTGSKA